MFLIKPTRILPVLVFSLVVSVGPQIAIAVSTTFIVDLANLDDFGSGSTLRVFGTITLDPDISDVGSAITDSSFQYQLNNEAPIGLSDFTNSVTTELDFTTAGGDLFVQAVGTGGGYVALQWNNNDIIFAISSSTRLSFVSLFDPTMGQAAFWEIPNRSAPVFLGTVVPEPTSIFLISPAGVVFVLRRNRKP